MKVMTPVQIKNAEKTAVFGGRFSYTDLMKKAGKAVFDEVAARYDYIGKRFLVVVGSGNNGGDGLVVADLLRQSGAFVTMYMPFGAPKSDPARDFLKAVSDIPVCAGVSGEYDFYIDALFGIGFNRTLTDDIQYLIDVLNRKSGVKISVDIPSGMFSDGSYSPKMFRADLTVTFIGYKLCQLMPETSSYCGEVVLNELGIDTNGEYSYSVIEKPVQKIFDKNAHKGTFGTALLICGSYGMCGAGILSTRAAVTSGAGIVKTVVCDKNYTALTQSVPEAVTIPVETSSGGAPVLYDKTILSAIGGATALVIGCGLGRSDEITSAVKRVIRFTNIPTVIDADGINAVSGDISILRNVKAPMILTPHPGEMARLLNTSVEDVEAHRVGYAKKFACDFQCVLALKGANTVVAAPNGEVYFNITGNYGMAKGGSGDILSGIIVALLANGYDTLNAALTAVYVHGKAGDNAAKKYTKRTVTPGDVLEELKFISF